MKKIPKFYDNKEPNTSNNNYKFPMQVASDMGTQSTVFNFNVQSFLPAYLKHVN